LPTAVPLRKSLLPLASLMPGFLKTCPGGIREKGRRDFSWNVPRQATCARVVKRHPEGNW
jgi:hypothetical protein